MMVERDNVIDVMIDAGCTVLGKLLPKDRMTIVQTLSLHHCLLSVKAELDQMCDGLKLLGVLDASRQHPELFSRFFLRSHVKQLSPGMALFLIN